MQKGLHQEFIIKLSEVKNKWRILKAAREKQLLTYKGAPTRQRTDFSMETLQARKEWSDISTILREKNTCQPRILHPESSPSETKDKDMPKQKS